MRITHISFFSAVCQLSRSLLCATADEVVLCWYQGGFFAIPRVVLIAHEVFYFHLHFSYNSSQKWPLQAQIKPRFVNKPAGQLSAMFCLSLFGQRLSYKQYVHLTSACLYFSLI